MHAAPALQVDAGFVSDFAQVVDVVFVLLALGEIDLEIGAARTVGSRADDDTADFDEYRPESLLDFQIAVHALDAQRNDIADALLKPFVFGYAHYERFGCGKRTCWNGQFGVLEHEVRFGEHYALLTVLRVVLFDFRRVGYEPDFGIVSDDDRRRDLYAQLFGKLVVECERQGGDFAFGSGDVDHIVVNRGFLAACDRQCDQCE